MTIASYERSGAKPTEQGVLLLRVAEEYGALPIADLREVVRWRAFTPVPGAPPVLPGVISHRGVVLPVADLRVALGLPAAAPTRATRYVLIAYDGIDLALHVDAVLDLHVALGEMEPPPATLDPQRGRLIRAIFRHEDMPVALLDLPALLNMLRGGNS